MAILIQVVVVLIIVGLVLWLVQTYLPLPPPIKTGIVVLIILLLILWLLNVAGVWGVGPIMGRHRW